MKLLINNQLNVDVLWKFCDTQRLVRHPLVQAAEVDEQLHVQKKLWKFFGFRFLVKLQVKTFCKEYKLQTEKITNPSFKRNCFQYLKTDVKKMIFIYSHHFPKLSKLQENMTMTFLMLRFIFSDGKIKWRFCWFSSNVTWA